VGWLTAVPVRTRPVGPPASAGSGLEPREGEAGITLAQALADPRQWYLNVSWLLQGGLAFMISVHAVPFVRDQGVALAEASLALTAYGIGSAAGRLAGGAVSDRIGGTATTRMAFVVQIAGLAGLVLWPSADGRFASLVAFGIGFAAADTMIVRVMPDVFGMRALGAIMGVVAMGWRFGAALGPTVAGALYDVTGSYRLAFGAAPGVVVLSWVFFALATSRARTRPTARRA